MAHPLQSAIRPCFVTISHHTSCGEVRLGPLAGIRKSGDSLPMKEALWWQTETMAKILVHPLSAFLPLGGRPGWFLLHPQDVGGKTLFARLRHIHRLAVDPIEKSLESFSPGTGVLSLARRLQFSAVALSELEASARRSLNEAHSLGTSQKKSCSWRFHSRFEHCVTYNDPVIWGDLLLIFPSRREQV